jgi:hypothetical protein
MTRQPSRPHSLTRTTPGRLHSPLVSLIARTTRQLPCKAHCSLLIRRQACSPGRLASPPAFTHSQAYSPADSPARQPSLTRKDAPPDARQPARPHSLTRTLARMPRQLPCKAHCSLLTAHSPTGLLPRTLASPLAFTQSQGRSPGRLHSPLVSLIARTTRQLPCKAIAHYSLLIAHCSFVRKDDSPALPPSLTHKDAPGTTRSRLSAASLLIRIQARSPSRLPSPHSKPLLIPHCSFIYKSALPRTTPQPPLKTIAHCSFLITHS